MRVHAQKQSQPQQQAPSIKGSSANHLAKRHRVQSLPYLQRSIGNQAVSRLLQANTEEIEAGSPTATSSYIGHDFSLIPSHAQTDARIQPKLLVNIPGDVYEQDADHVAEQVLHTSDAHLQRACACGGECPTCKTEQLSTGTKPAQLKRNQSGESTTPSFVQEVLHSPGQPLDAETRAFFEPRFGHNFSHVRVHTSERAAQSARALDATAYTAGNKIVFGAGNYAPETTEGKRLLAHELTHVIQQGSAESASSPIEGPVRHADGLNFIQRRVQSCPEWAPVNDSVVNVLISTALRLFRGNTRLAFEDVRNVRNRDEHCCDLNYTAADHYLFIMSDAGSCARATAWLGLSSVGRSPTLIVTGSQMHVQPLGSAFRTGNCPVSPLNPGVMKWELRAVNEVCERERNRIVSDINSYFPQ